MKVTISKDNEELVKYLAESFQLSPEDVVNNMLVYYRAHTVVMDEMNEKPIFPEFAIVDNEVLRGKELHDILVQDFKNTFQRVIDTAITNNAIGWPKKVQGYWEETSDPDESK